MRTSVRSQKDTHVVLFRELTGKVKRFQGLTVGQLNRYKWGPFLSVL